jgi:hypothetical protein
VNSFLLYPHISRESPWLPGALVHLLDPRCAASPPTIDSNQPPPKLDRWI